MRVSEELAIARAARRTALKWKAGESLRKKLLASGADATLVQREAERLAEALRSN